MTDDATIRPATPDDVGSIHDLIRELAEYENLASLVTGSADELRAALFGPRPLADVLVAEVGRKTVGFALFFPTFSTFLARPGLWLEDLYVQPAHRAHGIGTKLMRAVAEVAVARRCGRFEWAVLDWNVSAIGFYERLGATVMPDWRMARVTGDALVDLARTHQNET